MGKGRGEGRATSEKEIDLMSLERQDLKKLLRTYLLGL